jgi:hypothetical protein
MSSKHKLAWMILLGSVATTGCTEHIHDPWVEPGTMQVERNVGVNQQAQLDDRLLNGQSDR